MEGWAKRLRTGGVFVADVNGAIAGFVRIEDIGFVDLLTLEESPWMMNSKRTCI